MKKFIFCVSLAFMGLMTACVDKNEAVDADSKPSWLGESIYQELKKPTNLTGTFSTYLRLIDDLGESETLNRTGSKTVFPANDDAFERFFQSNKWGVSSYEQLSTAQKKMLLYSSMLDNALLVNMLSNVSNGSDAVQYGVAMKHQTSLNVIDTIQHIIGSAQMPEYNKYWDKFRDEDMYVVSDATRPMMVHFTREHMLQNGITTLGEESDFAILTGTAYDMENPNSPKAYIFDDAIINADVTCQNGYIHQMQDVIVPPGNMAQVLREDSETSYFSRVLDYFCAPFENTSVTNSYNAWALEHGLPTIEKIYEIRYWNASRKNPTDDYGSDASHPKLNFDPGYNQYSPNGVESGVDYTIADVAALFVPTDEAVKKFFIAGGDGAYLIDLYGKYQGNENTEEHLKENLDSLHSKRPEILTSFVNNLMKTSFTATVPSKFANILNDANEYMGITMDLLEKKGDRYDIKFANNGVIYKTKELVAPDEYQSVMAPASVFPDMQVMNWAVKEPDDSQKLNVYFHYYLMAMNSNFAFFIPDDEAFDRYYVDPTSLGHEEPRALHFVYNVPATGGKATVRCQAHRYNPQTNTIENEPMNNGAWVNFDEWSSLLIDILNFHTVVLNEGEKVGENKYYKTKHGGEIYISGGKEGDKLMSGQQIDNGVDPAKITTVYNEKNGTAYRIDHVIQGPRNSVYKTLASDSRFSEFYNLCGGFSIAELLEWAGISSTPNVFGNSEQDAYIVFTNEYSNGSTKVPRACLDSNIKMFNTYNYTLYAPNNEAMGKAYAAGLPRWEEINKLKQQNESAEGEKAQTAKATAKRMIDEIRDFVRYHFQSNSIYADNRVDGGLFNTLSTDEKGLALKLEVTGGSGKLYITDEAGVVHTIDTNDNTKRSNLMTRDFWFDKPNNEASKIQTSSFCVIHELSEPLNYKK